MIEARRNKAMKPSKEDCRMTSRLFDVFERKMQLSFVRRTTRRILTSLTAMLLNRKLSVTQTSRCAKGAYVLNRFEGGPWSTII